MKYGWPHLVSKELGFNELINLARCGSSTSGQLKLFLEQDFTNQDVYIIWMLTSPVRFSFYRNGTICNINPTVPSEIGKAYVDFLRYTTLDTCLEQVFYVKCMYNICKANNYKLIITYWDTTSMETQKLDSINDYYLTPSPENIMPYDLSLRSPICKHPNEKGYEYMANKIISYIDKNHRHYRVGTPVEKPNISHPQDKTYSTEENII